jgi:hypothetical protein
VRATRVAERSGAGSQTSTEREEGLPAMKIFLFDPKLFNYLIMSLYLLNALRWGVERKLADVCYWLSALAITATVTFLYKH